ncbi:hypothetical protein [Halorientalis persicus]|nr:hypothetical protein [Halorientalis persicus]
MVTRVRDGGRSMQRAGIRSVLVALGVSLGTSSVGAAQPVPVGGTAPVVPLEIRVAVGLALTVFVGICMLALFQTYTHESLDAIRANAPVSLAIGIGVQLVFLIIAFGVGFVSVLPLMGLVTLPVWIALLVFYVAWGILGVISVGRFVVNRVASGGPWLGLLVGAVLVVAFQIVPFGVVPLFLIVSLGMGGAVRRHMGASTSERSVPSGRF